MVSGESAASPEQERRGLPTLSGFRLAAVMLALMLTLLLEALDQTVVGTALPRIIARLQGFDRYTWAVTAYLLASTVAIPVAGKLSDQFGRKGFLLGGASIFLLGSALCGAAQTVDQLIIFRALQGLGAGAGISLVFVSVADIFPPERRARWQGVLGSVYGIASVTGPTLGGWLADHGPLLGALVTDDSRWRWVFYVNLPLGVVALAALLALLPADVSARDSRLTDWTVLPRIDFGGALLMASGTIALLTALTWIGEATQTGGSARTEVVLVAAAVLFAAFILTERAAAEPVLSPGLFRSRIFAADAVLTLLLWMALFGVALYVPLYLQGVFALPPTTAGAAMTPFSLSIVVGNALAGMTISFLGRYKAVTIGGTLIMAGGVLLLSRLMPSADLVQVAALVATAGLGMGILFTATTVAVQNALPASQLGAGFGAVRYLGQIGGVLGATVVGAVVNHSFSADLDRRLPVAFVKRLASEGVTLSAGPQVLVSPSYRQGVIRHAVRKAAARVPTGPNHDELVAAAMRQEVRLLGQAFQAIRFSLAAAIQHGLTAVVVFCGASILAAVFLKDAPMVQRSRD